MRSDGEETKNRILLAAGKVFTEKGFRKATNQDIAAVACANGAAISYYFRDKAGLYLGVWEEAQTRSQALYTAWLGESSDMDESFFRQELLLRLKRVMRCIYDWACDEESRDSVILFDELADESGVLPGFREDLVLNPLLVEMKRVLGELLDGDHDCCFLQQFLPNVYLSSIRGFCGRSAAPWKDVETDDLYENLERLVIQRLDHIVGIQISGKSSQFVKKERIKIVDSSSQLELGVTDEVAFELKHPTREEIILQEEKAKARMAEEEQSTKVEVPSAPVISPEEQLELF